MSTTVATESTETEIAITNAEQQPATTEPTTLVERSIEQQKLDAQAEYEERLEKAESVLLEATVLKAEKTKELKAAKKYHKDAEEAWTDLRISGPAVVSVVPARRKPKAAAAPISTETDPEIEKIMAEDKTWREITIAEVLSGVSGLGTKRATAITDHFKNLGAIQDARVEASREHKPFKDMLPDGIGPAIADALENRIGELIVNHSIKLREQIQIAKSEASHKKPSIDDLLSDDDLIDGENESTDIVEDAGMDSIEDLL